jgi:hypothetical protein
MHPDADSLSAFAEELLPAGEREQILAHMSTCARCREVIFLAWQAAAEDLPVPEPQRALRPSWFGGWRWAWIPAAAFALLFGFAVVLHFNRKSSQQQEAANLAQTMQPAASPQIASGPAARHEQAAENAKSFSAATKLIAPEKRQSGSAESKESMHGYAVALGKAAPTIAPLPGISGGSVHGDVAARASSSPTGGPIVGNQLQQSALQPQDQLLTAQNSSRLDANKPAATSETVSVSAQPQPQVAPAMPAPASTQLSYAPTARRKLELSAAAVGQLKKTAAISLPNGAVPLSTAVADHRIVAIDTSGALFLSIDNGKNWQPIPTQWTGRAVLLRTVPDAIAGAAQQNAATTHFELVTDKLQTWISNDGKTWTAQIPPGK